MPEEIIIATPPDVPVETPVAPQIEEQVAPAILPNKNLSKKQILMVLIPILVIFLTAVGYFLYQTLANKKAEISPTIQRETEPLTLTLTSPSEDSIVADSKIIIKGTTLPNTTVLLYTENADNSVESDQSGNFEGIIDLADGINSLTVTAYGENGEEKTLVYNLVYDSQVKGVSSTQGQVLAKSSSNDKKAVIGNVEKVTPNSVITGKDKKSTEIEVDKNTKIINQNKKEVKLNTLKKSDLTAIITDDETATSSKQLKKALKIYVREATASAQIQSKRKAISGVIQSISGNLITLTHQIQTERVYQLYTSNITVVKIKDLPTATIADLKAGQRIAAVGDLNEEGQLVTKRIHVIPGKATGVFNKYPEIATPSGTLTGTPTATPSGTLIITPTPTEGPILSPTPTIETPPNP